jgi:hypothetical protein
MSAQSIRLEANRANALLSTGPRTEEGKAKSCLNAVKTALTGRTILLSGDDAAEYQRHLAAFEEEFSPVGLRECELVQSIADTWWRLRRIPALESALFAKGRVEFANMFEEHELAARPHLIDAHTFLAYEKQIRNLQLQEARLARRREKETAELRAIQQQRMEQEEIGFEFSKRGAATLAPTHPMDPGLIHWTLDSSTRLRPPKSPILKTVPPLCHAYLLEVRDLDGPHRQLARLACGRRRQRHQNLLQDNSRT